MFPSIILSLINIFISELNRNTFTFHKPHTYKTTETPLSPRQRVQVMLDSLFIQWQLVYNEMTTMGTDSVIHKYI